jgi:hypothetical protein
MANYGVIQDRYLWFIARHDSIFPVIFPIRLVFSILMALPMCAMVTTIRRGALSLAFRHRETRADWLSNVTVFNGGGKRVVRRAVRTRVRVRTFVRTIWHEATLWLAE